MAEEWVSLWVQCLRGNLDYADYCEARRAGDKETCAKLEARFDRVADIYECPRRLNSDPPCRLNFDPGMEAGSGAASCG